MVSRLTIGKKKYAEVEAQMWNILNQAETLQKELKQAVKDDSSSFDDLLTAMRRPKDTPENIAIRDAEIIKATLNAAYIPLTVCEKTLSVMRLAIDVASAGNINALSDAGSAFSLARAAFNGASMNVQINLKGIEESTEKQALLNKLDMFKQDLPRSVEQIRQVMDQRGGITL